MKPTHVCRCCLSEACFKDISNEYYYGQEKEVYCTMLLDTFNLEIPYEQDNSRLICEECIVQLRSAAAFRKQVVHAIMGSLKNACADFGIKLSHNIELKDDFVDHITGEFDYDDDETSDYSCRNDDDCGWQDDNVLGNDEQGPLFAIKLETKELNPRKESDFNKNSRPSSILNRKLLNSSANGKDNNEVSISMDDDKAGNTLKRKTLKGPKKSKEKAIRKITTSKQKAPISQSQIDMKENSLKLLNNSNMCLFESLKIKFRCFYCKESYLKIQELREHTKTHSSSSEKYMKLCISRLKGLSYKTVDISSLSCKICGKEIVDLKELQNHLTTEHKLEFSSSEHLLIPYRLENGCKCVLCGENFNTYFKLSVHMNSHYAHNVCEICGLSYINRLSLRLHVSSIHKEKKCSICHLVFLNTYSKIKHMRKVHNTMRSQRYCLLCNKTFQYTYMLNEHKIKEHGVKRQISVCSECDKAFPNPQNLKIHMRCVHIKERNYACDYCERRFFTTCDKRRHEKTHEDVRLFACSYCEGKFKSKDSMRRHLRRQHGHLFIDMSLTQLKSRLRLGGRDDDDGAEEEH